MKKSTKILIFIALLITAISINAQEKCNFVCHNGKVVKTLNETSLAGHLDGHNDVFLGTCDDFDGQEGDDCRTLSLPELDFQEFIPSGIHYFIYDTSGRLYRFGTTDQNLFKSLPKKGIFFIKIRGYKAKKIYINE